VRCGSWSKAFGVEKILVSSIASGGASEIAAWQVTVY
jgi:hypothetical protein